MRALEMEDSVPDALQLSQAEIAAILDDQFEAAGGAQPIDRRRAKRGNDGPTHFLPAAIA